MSPLPEEPPRRPRRKPAFLGTWVAVAVAAALGAYLYFVESKREPGDGETPPREKVFALDKARASAIELGGKGREAVRVVRQGDQWRIEAPLAAEADRGEVEGLLGAVEGLEVDEVVAESAASLAEFGLEPPARTLVVRVEGGAAPLELHVGSRTPDGASVYARKPSAPRVFTLPSYVESTLDKKAFDLRDRDVLHLKRDAVRAVRITGPQGTYALAREGEDWVVTEPVRTLAGRWGVDGLLGSLEALRLEAIVAEDAPKLDAYGLEPPARTVTLTLADGSARALHLGRRSEDGKVHARDAATRRVVLVPPALDDDLAKGLPELRARRLLDVSTFQVARLVVAGDGGERTLVRSTVVDQKDQTPIFKWARSDGRAVETPTVQDALFAVGGVEATEFVDAPGAPAAYGLGTPALRVTMRDEAGKETWFELGTKDGAWYARRSGDAAVLAIDPAKAGELKAAFAKL